MREKVERFRPDVAKIIPEKMPGSNEYKAWMDLEVMIVDWMKKHPSVAFQIPGDIVQFFQDLKFKALMDNFIPPASRKRSPVRYSGVVPSFNGIREFDAPANAGDIKIPTYLIEAGKGEGSKGVAIVPHIQHKEFAKNNPNLVGWYRLENISHDMPVEAGPELAQLMIAIAENRVKEIPNGVRIDIDPKKDLRHILKDQPEKPAK
jgi:pimeloyl-ACP methyl ester carboxylesterase